MGHKVRWEARFVWASRCPTTLVITTVQQLPSQLEAPRSSLLGGGKRGVVLGQYAEISARLTFGHLGDVTFRRPGPARATLRNGKNTEAILLEDCGGESADEASASRRRSEDDVAVVLKGDVLWRGGPSVHKIIGAATLS